MNDILPASASGSESPGRHRTLNLRLLLVLAVSGLVLTGMLGVTGLHAVLFQGHSRAEAKRALELSARAVLAKSEELLEPAAVIARQVLSRPRSEFVGAPGAEREAGIERFLHAIEIVPAFDNQIYGAYLGFPDGSFAGLFKNVPELREAAGLPESAASSPLLRYVRNASLEPVRDRWSWIEAGRWRSLERPRLEFDPRSRPWYRLGLDREGAAWTGLYRAVVHYGYGITLAGALRGEAGGEAGAVLGVDVRLDDMVEFVRRIDVSPNAFAYFAQPGGGLIAHPAMEPDMLSEDAGKAAPSLFQVHLPGRADLRIFEALAGAGTGYAEIELEGETYIGRRLSLETLEGGMGLGADLYVGAPLSDFTAAADRVARYSLALAGLLTLGVILVGVLIARAVTRPIQKAIRAMDSIARLEEIDDAAFERSFLSEIDSLNASVGTMKTAMRSFGRYVPRELVRDLLALRQPLELGGRRREITVLFTDIRAFTTQTETEQHEALVETMADYFEILSSTIAAHGGTIDKFIGDSVMAFWGAPRDDAEHTRRALEAVVDCRARLEAFNRARRAQGLPAFETNFGLHRGYAFVGNIGARERFGYTALGDVVNTASRLEAHNRELGTQVLVTRQVVGHAPEAMTFEGRGTVRLRGKAQELEVFELVQDDTPAALRLV